jgi:hypothetical protein
MQPVEQYDGLYTTTEQDMTELVATLIKDQYDVRYSSRAKTLEGPYEKQCCNNNIFVKFINGFIDVNIDLANILVTLQHIESHFNLYLDVYVDRPGNRVQIMRDVGQNLADRIIADDSFCSAFTKNVEMRRSFKKDVCIPLFETLVLGTSHNDVRLANICVKGSCVDGDLKFTVVDWDDAAPVGRYIKHGNGQDARYPGNSTWCCAVHTAAQLFLLMFFIKMCSTNNNIAHKIEHAIAHTKVEAWWNSHVSSAPFHAEFLDFVKDANDDVQNVIYTCFRDACFPESMHRINTSLMSKEQNSWNMFTDSLLGTETTN